MTVREALSWAAGKLSDSGVPDPEMESEYLLSFALGVKRHALFLSPQRPLEEGQLSAFSGFIERRGGREPSQYITGETEFRGLRIKLTRDVLIPRPETEILVEEALKAAGTLSAKRKDGLNVLDLCTGSGCIAVSIARELPGSRVWAADVSLPALKVARENAELNSVSGSIIFLHGDLYGPVKKYGLFGNVDVIVSNPPYVARKDMDGLQPEIRDFEPPSALIGGEDGLDFIRRIAKDAPFFLVAGGYLLLEVGSGQAGDVSGVLSSDWRYTEIEARKDLSSIERVVLARRKG